MTKCTNFLDTPINGIANNLQGNASIICYRYVIFSQMVRISIGLKSPWSPTELIRRRHSLMEIVTEKTKHNERILLILKGCDPIIQSGVALPTKQKSSFRYLTGCSLASSTFLLSSYNGRIENTTLFYDRRTKTEELWDGEEMSEANMKEMFCIDRVEPHSSLFANLEKLSSPSTLVLYQSKDDFPSLSQWLSRCKMERVDPFLDRLRLVKSRAEIDAMKRSSEIG
ncbi:hypothetical protein PMAYCL1PPCAC_23810, partial [Pristionchus mayeri]